MLNNRQKALIGMYRNAAKLEDQVYRDLLYRVAGVRSTTDPNFNNSHMDEVMRRIEAILELRVINHRVPHPGGKIKDLHYWRSRNPGRNKINQRMVWEIKQLWDQLWPLLEPSKQNQSYLLSIAGHATTKYIRKIEDMDLWQANLLVEALKDRLYYATRDNGSALVSVATEPQQEELDF